MCELQVAAVHPNVLSLFATMGMINPSINPFIYAARYEVFRRYLKEKLSKNSVAPVVQSHRM